MGRFAKECPSFKCEGSGSTAQSYKAKGPVMGFPRMSDVAGCLRRAIGHAADKINDLTV